MRKTVKLGLILCIIALVASICVNAKDIYPLNTNVTLTYWVPLFNNVSASVRNLNDTPLYKEMEKRTGIKVKFNHPAFGQEGEQFNLMLASGDLPDIIEYSGWLTYPGGPEKAISDGVIVGLNDLINKYSPNLKKVLHDKDLNRMVKTDSGKYFVYPHIRNNAQLLVFIGPFLRQDWLTELGLQPPTTIDEWYTVLKAFKEKKKSNSPLTIRYDILNTHNGFVGAYGIGHDFYIDKGKVKYGPIQPQYKQFLATFHKWYAEGLISNDFGMVDQKVLDARMVSGIAGATVSNSGGGIGKYLDAMKKKDPKFDLVAVPYPTLRKGQRAEFGQRDLIYSRNGNAAITQKSKSKEIAARYLDYGYGPEGNMLFNFGIEGVSYTMINKYPTYTELIKNPANLTMGQSLARYTRGGYNGPFAQDVRYFEQYSLAYPQQKHAVDVWAKTNQAAHQMPPITPTAAESSEMAKIMSEVGAYRDEMVLKFIMGTEPLENFDKFVAQVKKMGIDQALKINQDALARYKNR